MSERAYNRVANILMLIAIASAVLFDSGKLPRAVVGAVGILAGVAALALYFWNQYEIGEVKKAADSSQKGMTPAETKAVESRPVNDAERGIRISLDAFLMANAAEHLRAGEILTVRGIDVWARQTKFHNDALEAYRRRVAQTWLSHYSENYARNLRWSFARGDARALMQPEVELSAKEVAACAIEIMRSLAIPDDPNREWEYSFGPKGLRVSLKKAHSIRPVVPQEDFDFGTISRTIQ